MNAFVTALFSYFPLVWMSHSRTMNNRINKITKKLSGLSIKMNQISLDDLLKKDTLVNTQQRNLQILIKKMYKERNDLASACNFTKSNTHGCFSLALSCTNSTKSRKASHMHKVHAKVFSLMMNQPSTFD